MVGLNLSHPPMPFVMSVQHDVASEDTALWVNPITDMFK